MDITLHLTVVGLFVVLSALQAATTSGSDVSPASVFSANKKLQVTLYYESLCPYCVLFVTAQLNPNYDAFKEYIDVAFVPFGNAKSYDNGTRFQCQHGPVECFENMLQSCSLYTLNGSPDAKMAYVACQMSPNADHTGRECAERLHIDWTEVQQCMTGGLGIKLQLEMEQLTRRVGSGFVPTVVFNGVYDFIQALEALKDFRATVCQKIDNAAPICTDPK